MYKVEDKVTERKLLTAYKVEDKVTERKLVKMLLKTYFSRIQGYIYPHIVAVMSLYLVFVGHSLNNYNTSQKYLKCQGQGHFRRNNCGS